MDLRDLWRGGLTLRRASVLALNLRNGSRIWQATGGPRAWADQYHALLVVKNRIERLEWRQTEDGSKGKNAPDMDEPPPFVGDEQVKAEKSDLRARQWEAQQRRIEAARGS